MRILMISDVFFPRVNGVSTSIQTFRREFEKMGHEVTLIAPEYPGFEETDESIIRIPSRGVWGDPEDRMLKYGKVLELDERLSEKQFDLIHIHTPFVAHYAGLALARRLMIPVVESYHTFFEEYLFHYIPYLPRKFLRFVARRFSRSQCNAVDGVVVPSTAMAEVLRGYGVDNNVQIIPTGIDLDAFTSGDGSRFRREHVIPPKQPMMLHIGRIAHEKNIDFLIDVLEKVRSKIPNILMVIAGEGPAKQHLQQLVEMRELKRHAKFVGYLDRESTLLDCYRSGDIFVFSSPTETQGLVLLEAMALGVPVLSTAVMGTRDVLQQGCGAIVAKESVNNFAKKAVMMLQDDELREALSKQGLEYVRQWSSPVMAETMLSFYEKTAAPETAKDEAVEAEAAA